MFVRSVDVTESFSVWQVSLQERSILKELFSFLSRKKRAVSFSGQPLATASTQFLSLDEALEILCAMSLGSSLH